VVRPRPRRSDHRQHLPGQGKGSRVGGHEAAGASLRTSGAFRDYAILYRGNFQARALEQFLRNQRIPYLLSGGQSFFEKAEIKDITAYLRLLANRTTTRPSSAPSARPGGRRYRHAAGTRQLRRRAPDFALRCGLRTGLRTARAARQLAPLLEFCELHQPPATRAGRNRPRRCCPTCSPRSLTRRGCTTRTRRAPPGSSGATSGVLRLVEQEGRGGAEDLDRPHPDHRPDQHARQDRMPRSTPSSCRHCTPPRVWSSSTSS
jgi:hypothetical protein